MSASITNFIDVNVAVGGAVAEKFSFGNFLGVFEQTITTGRMDGPFTSVAEVIDAGFTSVAAPEILNWATSVFAQSEGVDQCFVGRKIPSTGDPAVRVWQVEDSPLTFVDETTDFNDAGAGDWTVFPGTEAIADYAAIGHTLPFGLVTLSCAGGTAGVGGVVVWEYWNGVAWAALAGVTDGSTSFTAGTTAGQVVSWTVPTDWATTTLNASGGELYYVRARITTVFATNPLYTSGTVAGDATYADALTGIEAIEGSDAWYGQTIQSRVEAEILGVAAWTEARTHMFIAQSSDQTILTGTAGNVALDLQSAGYTRTALLYHATSSGSANGYADGAWGSRGFGADLDSPGGRIIWAYKQLAGITFDSVTAAQASEIYEADANLYGRNRGLSFTSKGTTAAGAPTFIDITTTNDWITTRLEEDILALFVGSPVIPYTNAGINLIAAAVMTRLQQGVTFGHFSPDVPVEVIVPDIQNVSLADKANRELTIQASAVYAGGIQKLTINLNLSFA